MAAIAIIPTSRPIFFPSLCEAAFPAFVLAFAAEEVDFVLFVLLLFVLFEEDVFDEDEDEVFRGSSNFPLAMIPHPFLYPDSAAAVAAEIIIIYVIYVL